MRYKILCALFLAISSIAMAHEYVLIAYKWVLHIGENLELHLFVADGFNVELERPFQKGITKSYNLYNGSTVRNLMNSAKDKTLPILDLKVDFKGQALITMERNFANISLENEKFLEYLKEDHLENITKINTNKKAQAERYARFIKCLVQSDRLVPDTLYKKIVNHRYEIQLLDNPYDLKTGDILHARLFFDQKPFKNKVVTARNRVGNLEVQSQKLRTDENGFFTIEISRKGDWIVHSTHMLPSINKTFDWDSFWVSYSFGIE